MAVHVSRVGVTLVLRTEFTPRGSPERVATRIADSLRALNVDRFDMKYSNGALPHERLMTSIELYASQGTPRVRELLASDALACSPNKR